MKSMTKLKCEEKNCKNEVALNSKHVYCPEHRPRKCRICKKDVLPKDWVNYKCKVCLERSLAFEKNRADIKRIRESRK